MNNSAITILEVLQAWRRRDGKPELDSYTGEQFEEYDLPIFGGCAVCGASIAAYNAAPSKGGVLACAKGCIGTHGFVTVEEFDKWLKDDEQ